MAGETMDFVRRIADGQRFFLSKQTYRERCANWESRGLQVLESGGQNPLCGDEVTFAAAVGSDGAICDVAWTGYSCVLCAATSEVSCGALLGLRWDGDCGAFSPTEDKPDGWLSYPWALDALGLTSVGASRRRCVHVPLLAAEDLWKSVVAAGSSSNGCAA